ncbi:hypothetical protein [Gimesia maris]|uniref:Uncharacterized protein n=1 Tax=Gimesia maris TaxID=122 RepID=A0ABX5YM53_9PLAN|nr:hypothetical protein [Gimesia maris]EDL59760.1 hypothetical protein PM8797T_31268 [Gimesia maris DSM 8797]QEG16744.1 hypothetical protein GmarT_26110 [Gimesia maris]QGQ30099.1 hypothetical protein F1729_16410 [Gimesia maris]
MLDYEGFFPVGLINSIGWEMKILKMLRDEIDEPKPCRIDGQELLANGRFRVAVAVFKSRDDAVMFRETARLVIQEIDGFEGFEE